MPNRFPWGDAFLVGTPALDKLSDRLYQEERLRQQQRYQESKMLDDEFSRNLAGIRDADIGDLTKSYGDYKMAYQQLMKKKGGVTPEQQMDVLRKKAAIYDIINKSKEQKAWEDAQAKQIITDKKGYYADDAHQQLLSRRRTPLSQLNFDNDANLLYQYSVPDLDKELKRARGEKPTEVRIVKGVSKDDPLKDDIEVYQKGNTPNQYYNSLLSDVVAKNQGRNFAGLVNNKYSDQELENLKNKYYAKVNDPRWKAIYGEPQPFPESATNTDLGRAVAIQTMEDVVSNELIPKTISEVNKDRADKRAMENWREKNALTYGQSLAKIRLNASLQGKEPVKLGDYDVLGKTYGNKEITGELNFPVGNTGFTETRTVTYIPATEVDINDKELFKGVRPLNVNGKQIYIKRENGDWEGANGQVISAEKVAKANFDRTTANEQVRGRTNFDNPKPKPQGKTMSAAEFRKLSITQRQQFLNSGGKVQ